MAFERSARLSSSASPRSMRTRASITCRQPRSWRGAAPAECTRSTSTSRSSSSGSRLSQPAVRPRSACWHRSARASISLCVPAVAASRWPLFASRSTTRFKANPRRSAASSSCSRGTCRIQSAAPAWPHQPGGSMSRGRPAGQRSCSWSGRQASGAGCAAPGMGPCRRRIGPSTQGPGAIARSESCRLAGLSRARRGRPFCGMGLRGCRITPLCQTTHPTGAPTIQALIPAWHRVGDSPPAPEPLREGGPPGVRHPP